MNRRNFFSTLIKGVGVFSILPPAEMYQRIWRVNTAPLPVFIPFWKQTTCKMRYASAEYLKFLGTIQLEEDEIQKAFFGTAFENKGIVGFDDSELLNGRVLTRNRDVRGDFEVTYG